MLRPSHSGHPPSGHQAREEPEAPEADIAAEIDCVYDEIRELVETRAGDPDLARRLQPLRERLEALEELEAEIMERHYRAQLQFDPEAGRRLLDEVKRRLGKI
jgi:hypothetical protein